MKPEQHTSIPLPIHPAFQAPPVVCQMLRSRGGVDDHFDNIDWRHGQFTIVGNQLQTLTSVIAGSFPITITASNGLGDNPTLTTTVTVAHFSGTYVPTSYIYGF